MIPEIGEVWVAQQRVLAWREDTSHAYELFPGDKILILESIVFPKSLNTYALISYWGTRLEVLHKFFDDPDVLARENTAD